MIRRDQEGSSTVINPPTDSAAATVVQQARWGAEEILDLLYAGFQHSRTVAPDVDAVRAAADLVAQQMVLVRQADTDLIAALRGALTLADHEIRDSSAAIEERYRQFVDLVRRWIIFAVNTGALTVPDANDALRYLTMPPPLRTHFEATVHTPVAIETDADNSDEAVAAAERLLRVELRCLRDASVHPTKQWQLRLRALDETPPTSNVSGERGSRYRIVFVVPLVVEVKALDPRGAISIAVDIVANDLDRLEVARAHTDKIRAVDVVPVHHREYDFGTD
ncbi:hypothetical protein [Micromonospora parva]|uniref:hypothetical protein n=1 Tax=Micromonospora parva TaxID=1464048 RepID=UPI0033E10269